MLPKPGCIKCMAIGLAFLTALWLGSGLQGALRALEAGRPPLGGEALLKDVAQPVESLGETPRPQVVRLMAAPRSLLTEVAAFVRAVEAGRERAFQMRRLESDAFRPSRILALRRDRDTKYKDLLIQG